MCVFMCRFSLLLCVHAWLQILHLYGFSPVWMRRCTIRLLWKRNTLWQCSQARGRSLRAVLGGPVRAAAAAGGCTGLGLEVLGPHFVWRTPLAYRGERFGGRIAGDLWVLGRGAPDLVEERLAFVAGLPDPRVFKMHVAYDEVPVPATSPARVITIFRDPRDVPYSMYRHLLALAHGPLGAEPPDFPTYVRERWMRLGHYPTYLNSYWSQRDDPRFLMLRFEDLKADLVGEARRICTHLGWDRTDAELEQVADLVDFRRMQQREGEDFLAGHMTNGRFFREGAVGRNRRQLGPELEVELMTWLEAQVPPEAFAFVRHDLPGDAYS